MNKLYEMHSSGDTVRLPSLWNSRFRMLAEGSAGRVVNAHGDAILVWLPEVAWEILCTEALANGHFSLTINYSKRHLSTSE